MSQRPFPQLYLNPSFVRPFVPRRSGYCLKYYACRIEDQSHCRDHLGLKRRRIYAGTGAVIFNAETQRTRGKRTKTLDNLLGVGDTTSQVFTDSFRLAIHSTE